MVYERPIGCVRADGSSISRECVCVGSCDGGDGGGSRVQCCLRRQLSVVLLVPRAMLFLFFARGAQIRMKDGDE